MQRERIKRLLDEMTQMGIIRITYDPYNPDPSNAVEIWTRSGSGSGDRDLEYWRPSREEMEWYASEFSKCFGTAPRSDEK